MFLHRNLRGFLVLPVFGHMVPLVGLVLRLEVLMLVFGRILLGSWLSFVLFLSSLHWPSTVSDLGVGGVSLVELLILYER